MKSVELLAYPELAPIARKALRLIAQELNTPTCEAIKETIACMQAEVEDYQNATIMTFKGDDR